jgi:hypothetical protein
LAEKPQRNHKEGTYTNTTPHLQKPVLWAEVGKSAWVLVGICGLRLSPPARYEEKKDLSQGARSHMGGKQEKEKEKADITPARP